jgi:hypothetical protein
MQSTWNEDGTPTEACRAQEIVVVSACHDGGRGERRDVTGWRRGGRRDKKIPVRRSAHGVPLEQATLRYGDGNDFFAAVTGDEFEVVVAGCCDGDAGAGLGGQHGTVL